MDIVKAATDSGRAEVLSAAVFAAFGLAFLLAGLGFRQLGTTDMARAFGIPMLVASGLLLILGAGLFFPARDRLAAIPALHAGDSQAFLVAEIARTDKVLKDYRIAVFRVFPAIIALCALLVPFLDTPPWRAGLITAIAMFTVLLLVDANADARLQSYKAQLAAAPPSS